MRVEFSMVFDKKAAKRLEKLPKETSIRIFRRIDESKPDPYRFFERLEGRDDYKLRIGDYRVIADIDKDRKTIQITKIGHRRSIYKRD